MALFKVFFQLISVKDTMILTIFDKIFFGFKTCCRAYLYYRTERRSNRTMPSLTRNITRSVYDYTITFCDIRKFIIPADINFINTIGLGNIIEH